MNDARCETVDRGSDRLAGRDANAFSHIAEAVDGFVGFEDDAGAHGCWSSAISMGIIRAL